MTFYRREIPLTTIHVRLEGCIFESRDAQKY